ncbi:MAG: hypothetical protein B7Y41_03160 [Hydrogenophilales bacterium 28-61-23]|nr:MAG: hypothetical protein B7Y41_03160 [Hydrogenophilales bacterium 28-61-23]
MKYVPSALFALTLAASLSANAAPVSITNHSFESTVLADGINGVGIVGWINSTGGAFNPRIGPTGHFTNPIPDGNNTAWLNGGGATQTLISTLLTANTAYTLMVEVGDRRDNVFPGYQVALLAGNTVLASESSLQPNDGFLTSTVNYTALAGNPLLGTALTIRLTANGTQVNFDNVRLDVSPVPEPETYALMLAGLGLVGFAARRRSQV